ncbi:MAG: hypothetical protein AAFN13_17100 [Bacteroidota bacterium]
MTASSDSVVDPSSSVALALVRIAGGSPGQLALWHRLLWEHYLQAGQPFGTDEADCLRWWETQVARDGPLLPDA